MKNICAILLSLLLLTVAHEANGAAVEDVFYVEGIRYSILDVDRHTVAVHGCMEEATGAISIPATVTDSVNVVWTVTQVGGSASNAMHSGVTSVTLPEGIVTLARNAIAGSSVTALELPASVETVEDLTFLTAGELQSITVAAGNASYKAEDGVLYTADGSTLVVYPRNKTAASYSVAEGCTSIRPLALYYVGSLKELALPASFVEWTYYTLNGSWYGAGPVCSCKQLQSVTVAEGNSHFKSSDGVLYSADMTKLVYYPTRHKQSTSYTADDIAETVSTLGFGAFFRDPYLAAVVIPAGVTTLENAVFRRCSKLADVTIPAGVKSVGETVFAGCLNLKAIGLESGNTSYKVKDDVLFTYDLDTLVAYPCGRAGGYTVPDGTKMLADGAFLFASELTSLTIDADLTTIGNQSMRGCDKLTEVIFAEGSRLERIKEQAFFSCPSLASLTFPASLEVIEKSAFYDCNALQSVTFADGSKLAQISRMAFVSCDALESITFLGTHDGSTELEIGSAAFRDCSMLTSLALPATTTVIGNSAFNGCNEMATVEFLTPSSIRTIGEGAFQNCGLTSIDLPSTVETIENSAFNSCHNLQTVNIPAATTSIDPRAFLFCSSLTNISVDEANAEYADCDGYLLSKDKTELKIFPSGKANRYFTLLPPSLTRLGDYSFYYCKQLENVCIPKKVTSIGDYAFDLCSSLNAIAFLTDDTIAVANVAEHAFHEANLDRSAITLYVRAGKEGDYKSSGLWSTFGAVKTSFVKDNKEYMPMSNTAVNLLSSADDVHTLVVPATVADDGGNSYDVRLVGDYAFEDNASSRLKEVVLMGAVGYVGARAFINSTGSIESVFFVNGESDGSDGVSSSALSTERFELQGLTDESGRDYNEFAASQHIYVRKSLEETFKGYTPAYAEQVTYKIPFVQEDSLGTFAREFDADFSDFGLTGDGIATPSGEAEPLVTAYAATGYELKGESECVVEMTKFYLDDETKEGVYVPAGTGALLRSWDTSRTAANAEDSYYRIGEQDINAYDDTNMMIGQVVDDGTAEAADGLTNYVVEKGRLVPQASTVTIPVHTAYLQLNAETADKDIVVKYEEEATGVNTMSVSAASERADCYDLQGRRVASPTRGLYIVNGRKVMVK